MVAFLKPTVGLSTPLQGLSVSNMFSESAWQHCPTPYKTELFYEEGVFPISTMLVSCVLLWQNTWDKDI